MAEEIPLRIVVVDPPPGVPWALQLGRDELQPPRRVDGTSVVFDFTVTLGPPGADGVPTFRGPATQGPPAKRFVYLTSGRRAGDAASPWERRAKIPLGGITTELLAARRAAPGGAVLEARIAGTDRRGGPACATVPVVGGWRVGTVPPDFEP